MFEAKPFLFDFSDKLSDKTENTKRMINRAQGVNKKRNAINDVFDLYLVLAAVNFFLPKFAAAKLSHLPIVSPGEVDAYTLAQTVNMMPKATRWYE